ncbi:neck protein [Agrobacterium phage OLIVR5]|uniref:Neck protein n=3 Tax=Caudoviricetes TaxID=2731619 RepID=A0A858MZ84_9CAUD|nr:neck protein [Agrobacterium phage OLIVR5]QIW87865.1 neck protein [Agrobacterium phage OLIVR5]QIW88130.1 neck protein [Agrobacterium phage OLIVR6]
MSTVKPISRDQLIKTVLERMGHPDIHIPVTGPQLQHLAQEAITRFVEFHYQSTTKAYLDFEITEELKASKTIKMPNFVVGVDTILSYKINDFLYRTDAYGASMWSMLSKNHFGQSTSLSKVDIYLYERELSEWEAIFQTMPKFVFSKTNHELVIEGGSYRMNLGSKLLVRCSISLEDFEGEFFSNSWLIRYMEALVRIKMGENLSNWSDLGLPGGVKYNGPQILDRGEKMKAELEEEMLDMAYFESGIVIG